MDKKSGFAKRLEAFFDGKGFYIVLSLCVVVTGISAWMLLAADTETGLLEDEVPTITDDATGQFIPPPVEDGLTVGDWDGEETDAGTPVTPSPLPSPTPDTVETTPTPAPSQQPEEDDPEQVATISDLQFIWPVSGEITQVYSPADLVFSKTMNDWRTHDAVDIAAQLGTKVLTVADGTVEDVFVDDLYGTTVVIFHADGLRSIYANLAGTPTVEEGDAVTMGSVIGSVSDTAMAEIGEVSHLHFGMTLDGAPVDPAEYLPAK